MDLLSGLNNSIFRMINDLGKQFTYLNPVIAFIAEYMVFFLALSVIIFWFTRKKQNRMMVICATIAFVISEVIGKIAGKFYSHQQPFAVFSNVNQLIAHEVDNSFPSDHTLLFFSFCVTFLLFKKRYGFLWILLAFSVGFSRIWAGLHYPVDIIVAAAIGSTLSLIVYQVVPRLLIVKKFLGTYEKVEQSILSKKTTSKIKSRISNE